MSGLYNDLACESKGSASPAGIDSLMRLYHDVFEKAYETCERCGFVKHTASPA